MATAKVNEFNTKDNYNGMDSNSKSPMGKINLVESNPYGDKRTFRENNLEDFPLHSKEKHNKGKDYNMGNVNPSFENNFKNKDNLRNNYDLSRNAEFKQKENEFRSKDNSFRPRDNELRRTKYVNSIPFDKDDEDEDRNLRSRKTSETRSRSSQMNELEFSDKLEISRRLEREKKIIQKKNREEDSEKPRKPVLKQKRSNKDWIRDYEYDLLDEDY